MSKASAHPASETGRAVLNEQQYEQYVPGLKPGKRLGKSEAYFLIIHQNPLSFNKVIAAKEMD